MERVISFLASRLVAPMKRPAILTLKPTSMMALANTVHVQAAPIHWHVTTIQKPRSPTDAQIIVLAMVARTPKLATTMPARLRTMACVNSQVARSRALATLMPTRISTTEAVTYSPAS